MKRSIVDDVCGALTAAAAVFLFDRVSTALWVTLAVMVAARLGCMVLFESDDPI